MTGRGTLVTETLPFGASGRSVTAYLPAEPPTAVVFTGDGQLVAPWGFGLESARLPPTMVVGVHRAADETQRLHEYSPGFDRARFAAHEELFVLAVPAWVEGRFGVALPSDRTAVHGVSAGGELALALGLRHPDRFGAVLCASPGAGYRPPPVLPVPLPRVYLVAGRQEPFFLDNATRWAAALHDAGTDVVMEERDGGHGDSFWQSELTLMVGWAFGS